MPSITIYLPPELYAKVMGDPSKIVQEALRKHFKIKKEGDQRGEQ